METAGKYKEETERILMSDKKYPRLGYRPIDIRERIEKLLEIEKEYKKMSKVVEKHFSKMLKRKENPQYQVEQQYVKVVEETTRNPFSVGKQRNRAK